MSDSDRLSIVTQGLSLGLSLGVTLGLLFGWGQVVLGAGFGFSKAQALLGGAGAWLLGVVGAWRTFRRHGYEPSEAVNLTFVSIVTAAIMWAPVMVFTIGVGYLAGVSDEVTLGWAGLGWSLVAAGVAVVLTFKTARNVGYVRSPDEV